MDRQKIFTLAAYGFVGVAAAASIAMAGASINTELNVDRNFPAAIASQGYTNVELSRDLLPQNLDQVTFSCGRQAKRYFNATNAEGNEVRGLACQSVFSSNVTIKEFPTHSLQHAPG